MFLDSASHYVLAAGKFIRSGVFYKASKLNLITSVISSKRIEIYWTPNEDLYWYTKSYSLKETIT